MRLGQGASATLMVRPESVHFLAEDFVVGGVLQAEYALGSGTQYKIQADKGDDVRLNKPYAAAAPHERTRSQLVVSAHPAVGDDVSPLQSRFELRWFQLKWQHAFFLQARLSSHSIKLKNINHN